MLTVKRTTQFKVTRHAFSMSHEVTRLPDGQASLSSIFTIRNPQ